MKKISCIFMSLLLLVAAGCSDDKDDSFPRTPVNTTEPTIPEGGYSMENLFPADEDKKVSTKDGWTVTTYGDMITKVEFGSLPPSNAEIFFKENIAITENNRLVKSGNNTYWQFYKGIPVYRCGYKCSYEDKRLTMIEGRFVPITYMDINPTVSEKEAIDIAKANSGFDDVTAEANLQIVPFFVNGTINVYLAYIATIYPKNIYLQIYPQVFIDAKTGKILYTNWS